MAPVKALVICHSMHHGNTMRIAKTIARELRADIKLPSEVDSNDFTKYDLIGFGSGIYNRKHHISLFNLLDTIKQQNKLKSFIFSTATICYKKMHEPLRIALNAKGVIVIDEFICRGFMNYSFTKYFFGGLNKKRPNELDFINAADFAINLKNIFQSSPDKL